MQALTQQPMPSPAGTPAQASTPQSTAASHTQPQAPTATQSAVSDAAAASAGSIFPQLAALYGLRGSGRCPAEDSNRRVAGGAGVLDRSPILAAVRHGGDRDFPCWTHRVVCVVLVAVDLRCSAGTGRACGSCT